MNPRVGPDPASSYLTIMEDGEPLGVWLEPPRKLANNIGGAALLAGLLAPVLGGDADRVADTLITTFRSLSAVLAARGDRLAAVPGMSSNAVNLISMSHQIAGWIAKEEISRRELLGSGKELESFVRAKLRCKQVEIVYGLFLDRKNGLIADVQLGEGTVDHVPLYPREVARHALTLDASAVILVHNHPSGDPTPSPGDIDMTRQVARALVSINVALHDHLVVGDNRIASMRQLRLI